MLNILQAKNVNECLSTAQLSPQIAPDNRYTRSEEEDMKKAIEYLYEFKRKLDNLHPNCVYLIENMLQNKCNR